VSTTSSPGPGRFGPAPARVGACPLFAPAAEAQPSGRLIEIGAETFYRIDDVDRMPPFLTTVASDSDHWMFVSSTGGLTAGRHSPDQALFPYTTDDRLHEAGEHTGPRTVIRVTRVGADSRGASAAVWEPFSSRYAGVYRVTRALAKSVVGNQLCFEETNHDLQLRFSYRWAPSDRFGFVRRVELHNLGDTAAAIAIADGLQNILPAGLGRRFQMEYSTLGDGYKDSELDAATGLGIFRLSSIPVDAPEPSEALRASTVWSHGLPAPRYFLSASQLDGFRLGHAIAPEARLRGRRGNYFVTSDFALAAGARQVFYLVAHVEQDAADVVASQRRLRDGGDLSAAIEADVERGTNNLFAIVAAADGVQAGGDQLASARHFANVLFNCMRGGIPADGYQISRDDFTRFVAASNRRVYERQLGFLAQLPMQVPHRELLSAARAAGDPQVERLAHEYLPFTFSRRHGDPSRPWNIFAIAVKDRFGNRRLDYQGNWRDIFQNWEALARSFPGYAISMIFKFAGSSTADGYNPYRVTRDGFDWEVLDPHDPWSHIGYWGDHQVIYLQRLLEVATAHDPGALAALLDRRVFSFANVPYRIKPYQALLRDPRSTIDFDLPAHRAALARVQELGSDGRLLADAQGQIVLVSLAEKLLIMTLAKLSNFVPGVGLWMNTQRPEWNDANNALVGNGASMVTVYHLRRFLASARGLFASTLGSRPGLTLSAEVAQLLEGTCRVLERESPDATTDRQRRSFLDAIAQPFDTYRAALYARGLSGETRVMHAAEVIRLCDLALGHVDRAIAANRRADGLYHAYNLMKIDEAGIGVRRLDLMLEGQVALLGAGVLDGAEALALLHALRASALYRADQGSYLLYPDKELPLFLEKNRIAPADVRACPLIARLLETHHQDIVVRDVDGQVHFSASCRNERLLRDNLFALAAGSPALAVSATERQQLLDIYERVFDHHAFTGRSGSLYKYEGLGCIYWHMVSKLRLVVHEILMRALRDGAAPAVIAGLRGHYAEICAGLGVHKSPAQYGAFTTDPYSHTPSFAGVQQPGMTGQVKEDILARLGELGVIVEQGRLTFHPALIAATELSPTGGKMTSIDLAGRPVEVSYPAGGFALHVCQVPVVVHRAGPVGIVSTRKDGSRMRQDALALDAAASQGIFTRTGVITRLDVYLGLPS
jgi:hypothetical protein